MKFKYRNSLLVLALAGAMAFTGCTATNSAYRTVRDGSNRVTRSVERTVNNTTAGRYTRDGKTTADGTQVAGRVDGVNVVRGSGPRRNAGRVTETTTTTVNRNVRPTENLTGRNVAKTERNAGNVTRGNATRAGQSRNTAAGTQRDGALTRNSDLANRAMPARPAVTTAHPTQNKAPQRSRVANTENKTAIKRTAAKPAHTTKTNEAKPAGHAKVQANNTTVHRARTTTPRTVQRPGVARPAAHNAAQRPATHVTRSHPAALNHAPAAHTRNVAAPVGAAVNYNTNVSATPNPVQNINPGQSQGRRFVEGNLNPIRANETGNVQLNTGAGTTVYNNNVVRPAAATRANVARTNDAANVNRVSRALNTPVIPQATVNQQNNMQNIPALPVAAMDGNVVYTPAVNNDNINKSADVIHINDGPGDDVYIIDEAGNDSYNTNEREVEFIINGNEKNNLGPLNRFNIGNEKNRLSPARFDKNNLFRTNSPNTIPVNIEKPNTVDRDNTVNDTTPDTGNNARPETRPVIVTPENNGNNAVSRRMEPPKGAAPQVIPTPAQPAPAPTTTPAPTQTE